MAELTMDQIKVLVEMQIKEALEFDEIKRILDKRPGDYGVGELEISGRAGDLLQPTDGNYSQENIVQAVDKLLDAQGIQADKTSFVYKRLCREMEKAQAQIKEVQRKRDQGDY